MHAHNRLREKGLEMVSVRDRKLYDTRHWNAYKDILLIRFGCIYCYVNKMYTNSPQKILHAHVLCSHSREFKIPGRLTSRTLTLSARDWVDDDYLGGKLFTLRSRFQAEDDNVLFIMASLRKTREMIVIAYAEGLLTDEEFRVSSSEVGSTSIPDEFSSSRILRLNFSLINLNRSLTDRLFTRNLAVSQVLRWFEISSQILPLSTVLSLNLYGWQTSISRQRRRSCSSFHSMLANPVNKEKADKTISLISRS